MKNELNDEVETQTRAEERKSQASGKPVTVLHVDDDPNDTALLQVACAKAAVEFELHNVGDGRQVIEYLSGAGKFADRARYRLPALILLDMKMPGVHGLDVIKWIRDQETLRNLPVVVLSGSELQEDIRRAYAGGADSYFVKPPSLKSLTTLVRELGARFTTPAEPSRMRQNLDMGITTTC